MVTLFVFCFGMVGFIIGIASFQLLLSLCISVIRAKAVSEKEVDSGNDIYGNPIKHIQYEIKQIKVTNSYTRTLALAMYIQTGPRLRMTSVPNAVFNSNFYGSRNLYLTNGQPVTKKKGVTLSFLELMKC